MTENLKSIPTWILVVSAIFAILGLIVSSSLVFSPQSVLKSVDLSAKGVNYLVWMWSARQFAEAFIFGYAAFKRSRPMLTLAYIFFLVMNIGDFLIGIVQKDNSLMIGALIMCIVAPTMIYFINKPTK
jgi:hypothetical protein